MRLLLDTNIVIRLGSKATPIHADLRRSIIDANEIYMSSIARAEIAIKLSIGKLELPNEERSYWEGLMTRLQAIELPFTGSHAARLTSLPRHHQDPFDRMIVAQCLDEDLTLVTTDAVFQIYGVNVLT